MKRTKQDNLDQSKRQTLRRLAVGAAFVAPLVTSVSVNGLTISKVHAGTASSSSMKDDGKNGGHKNGGHKNFGGKNFGGKNFGGKNFGGKNFGYKTDLNAGTATEF